MFSEMSRTELLGTDFGEFLVSLGGEAREERAEAEAGS
jgi:hypothetical protein